MLRKIITIDKEKCIGCGLCVSACHEGAIGMEDGKAVLLRDDYCDGLGDCLPVCPTGAISFEEREALPYDAAAVAHAAADHATEAGHAEVLPCGCPGTHAKAIRRASEPVRESEACAPEGPVREAVSQLNQWPVQIKLVPVHAPYFDGAHLLVSADCAAYAHGGFHQTFMRNRITLIGCPKLDEGDYAEKLTAILRANDIKSVTVVRMEVPCCGGLAHAVERALEACGKRIPSQTVTITTDGRAENNSFG